MEDIETIDNAENGGGRGDASCSAWTQRKPNGNGWWWFRHIVGAIPTDCPLEVMRMTGPAILVNGEWEETWNDYLSVYYDGRWRDLKSLPSGYRYLWSSAPIAKPNVEVTRGGVEARSQQGG